MTKGILYLIPVPIAEGDNSGLIYPLLEQTISSLDEFIVEDLKTARRSLRKVGYKGDFDKTVFHILNEHIGSTNTSHFLNSIEKGKSIGLMSEAGMPCIADPGSDIVRLAHKKNIRVVPFYGQSSIFLSLSASGLNGQNFCFHGYLPKEQIARKKKIKDIDKLLHAPSLGGRAGVGCHIFIETPYRNNHLFEDILAVCAPEILFCIARNVTGISEMIVTKTIADWKRGEFPDLNKQPTVFLLGI